MNKYLLFVFFSFFAGCVVQGDEELLKKSLPGRWKEDQYKRKNLNNYLYEMGLNWFKRIYVTASSWENTQDISFNAADGGYFDVHGTKGPSSTRYNFALYPDGRRTSTVDLGQLGGKTVATAKYEGNTLTTFLHKKGKLLMTAQRIMNPDKPDEMVYVARHAKSGVAVTQFFYRQN